MSKRMMITMATMNATRATMITTVMTAMKTIIYYEDHWTIMTTHFVVFMFSS